MSADDATPRLAEHLERGHVAQIAHFPLAPFPLPIDDDRAFLLGVRRGPVGHKNISYNPLTGKANGFTGLDNMAADRLARLLRDFSSTATAWLADLLPDYAKAWTLDRVSLSTDEEATRRLRHKARNDLLHIDAFPSRPILLPACWNATAMRSACRIRRRR
jgi:hypothetical protein